jgi:hypothetical protein
MPEANDYNSDERGGVTRREQQTIFRPRQPTQRIITNYPRVEQDSDSDYEDASQEDHHNRGDGRYPFSSPVPNFGRQKGTPSVKPDQFDGQEDWEQYYSHFLNCAALGNWPEKTQLLVLSSCLKGSARTFYIGLPQEDKHSYRNLVRRLDERFGSSKQQPRY